MNRFIAAQMPCYPENAKGISADEVEQTTTINSILLFDLPIKKNEG